MKRLFSILFVVLFVLCLYSCATGSAVVTGTKRPATDPGEVVIYAEAPAAKYEIIGIVNASSESGWTDQKKLDYAVEELKNQAAKLGANGIILGDITTTTTGGYVEDGFYSTDTAKNVTGKAIYIFKE